MQAPVSHTVWGQRLWLSPYRCIFWEQEQVLIVSDLHFGKTGHFRKMGIGVPQTIYKEDLQRLLHQVQYFQPRQLIVVGDFFHSHANKELELFKKWRNDFPALAICLVKGNHDMLQADWYRDCGIELVEEELQVGSFHFRHDLADKPSSDDRYFFSGHLHPGVRLQGTARPSLLFPCFYFTGNYCVLPAFSVFTGTVAVRPLAGDRVFAIVENSIVTWQ